MIWILIVLIGINILSNLFPSRFEKINTAIKTQLSNIKWKTTGIIFSTTYPWAHYIERNELNSQIEKMDEVTADNKKIENSEDVMGIWFAKFANWSLPIVSFVDNEAGGSSATYADPSYFTYQMMMAMKKEADVQNQRNNAGTVQEQNQVDSTEIPAESASQNEQQTGTEIPAESALQNEQQTGTEIPAESALQNGQQTGTQNTSAAAVEENGIVGANGEVSSATAPYNPLTKVSAWALKIGYSMEELQNFEFLMDNIYIVSNGASVTQNELNTMDLLSRDVTIEGNRDLPQILIYHTHSQEAFADSTAGDVSQTVVGLGNILTDILVNTYGYNVIHYQGVFDVTDNELDRESSYERALPKLGEIVTENPSIELMIDLHRDGVDDNVHLVSDINGVSTAKIMLLDGLSRDNNGEITSLPNSYREDNLSFSLQLYLAGKAAYPDFIRSIYLKSSRYNQHLRKSILVEVGAQNNTVAEAVNAIGPLADILNQVLSK